MKKIFLLILAITCLASNAYCQDKFRVGVGAGLSYIPVKFRVPYITYDNTSFYSTEPPYTDYKVIDTTGALVAGNVYLGISFPFYKTERWSVGANLNAGAGTHQSDNAAGNLQSFVLDFPQYIYYRNFANDVSYTVLLGYKYTRAALNYHMPMAAVEIGFGDNLAFRLSGSLRPYHYYLYYTTGKVEPAITIREYAFTSIYYF